MRYKQSLRSVKGVGFAAALALAAGGCGGVMPGTCLDGAYSCPDGDGNGAAAAEQEAQSAAERAQQAAEEARRAAERAERAAEKAGNIFDQGMQK
ncbi:MAG: hypothetical protein GF344_17295 [Chitinivibrionales bacterium]|nr:hypothetical protein [Chitinivibrionales bacterium]MBD3358426.1 hypothetical protein [Chitinivibrionales bacterium]